MEAVSTNLSTLTSSGTTGRIIKTSLPGGNSSKADTHEQEVEFFL